MPPETPKNNIVDRIRKLLARTVERGATEPEMQASIALAAKLMDKYCISRSEMVARESEHGLRPIWSGATIPAERDFVELILKEYFHVRPVFRRSIGRVIIEAYGRPAHRETADYIFNMLLQTYRRLYSQYRANTPRLRRCRGRRLSYYLGLTSGLYVRLRGQRGRDERAIVQTDAARDAAFDRDMGMLPSVDGRKFTRVPAAINAGFGDADKLNIRPAMSAK